MLLQKAKLSKSDITNWYSKANQTDQARAVPREARPQNKEFHPRLSKAKMNAQGGIATLLTA